MNATIPIRCWRLWAVYDDNERVLLNEQAFVGNASEAGCEADRLAFEMDGCFDFELESLGIIKCAENEQRRTLLRRYCSSKGE